MRSSSFPNWPALHQLLLLPDPERTLTTSKRNWLRRGPRRCVGVPNLSVRTPEHDTRGRCLQGVNSDTPPPRRTEEPEHHLEEMLAQRIYG